MALLLFPWVVYGVALSVAGLQKLNIRRQRLTDKRFNEIESNDSNRLHTLLSPRNWNHCSLRTKHKFNVKAWFHTSQFIADLLWETTEKMISLTQKFLDISDLKPQGDCR